MKSTKGSLLVSGASLNDPNFHRSVLFVIEHDLQGALGVVLNKPLALHPEQLIDLWAERVEEGGFIYSGGPVSTNAVIGLARTTSSTNQSLTGNVEVLDLHFSPSERSDVEFVRLFVGYAGWSAGQLEAEIDAGSWFVFEASESDIFTDSTEDLWERVLARQGGLISQMASAPDDLSEN